MLRNHNVSQLRILTWKNFLLPSGFCVENMDDTERYSGSSHGILDGDYWNRLSLTTDGGRPRRPIKDLYTHASSAPGVAPQSKPLATSDAPERTSMAGRSKCREREAPSARGSQHKRKASPHVARREGTLKRAKIQGQQGKVRPSQPLCGSSKIKSNKSKPAALKHGKTSPKNEVASLPTLQKSKSVTGSIDRKTTKAREGNIDRSSHKPNIVAFVHCLSTLHLPDSCA